MEDLIRGMDDENLLHNACHFHEQGQLNEADILYSELLARDINNHRALHLKGILENQRGNLPLAIDLIKKAITVVPSHIYYNNLAMIYKAVGQWFELANCLKESLTQEPQQEEIRSNLEQLIPQLPQKNIQSDMWVEIGSNYYRLGQYDKALDRIKLAISLNPKNANAHCNLALTLSVLGHSDKAIASYRKALKISPDHIDANQNFGQLLLRYGDFKQAASHFRYRLMRESIAILRLNSIPEWRGGSLTGKHLLLLAEQGIGDEIMFSTVFEELANSAMKLTIECDQRLIPIFKRSFPHISYIERVNDPALRQDPHGVDLYAPMGEALLNCRKKIQDFNHSTDFCLKVNSERAEYFKYKYTEMFGSKKKWGIAWRSKSIVNPEERSIDLVQLAPILQLPNIQFINLQYGDVAEEVEGLKASTGIEIYCDSEVDPLINVDEFLAQIEALDHVITIDNSTIHFAGSIKKSATLLLPINADWRWLLHRKDSIFYESVEIYRQTKLNDWKSVVDDVLEEI
jgi:Flp pilus assembly protein TadD